MRSFHKSVSIALTFFFVVQTVTPPTLMAGNPFAKLKRLVEESKYKGTEPCSGQDCAIECLAENIDWLEHYIDEYGSVVAKQPDV
ncbi:MAG: hypothetical protein AAGG48_10725 [Planctomycetota bacterium]